jgi:hypothetical protein
MSNHTSLFYISFGILGCISLYRYYTIQQTLDECEKILDECSDDLLETQKTLLLILKMQQRNYRQINEVIETLNTKTIGDTKPIGDPEPKPIGEPEPIEDPKSEPIGHPDDLFEELSHYYVTVDADDTNVDTNNKPTFIKSAKNLLGL